MKIKLITLSFIYVFAGVLNLEAGSAQSASNESELFKTLSSKLVGTWKGHDEQKPDEKIRIEYETTAGGSALVEKIMPGSDHEMISIYHPEGKKIAMTHYCMIGNQPHMLLKKSDGNRFEFDFVSTAGINPKKDSYMGKLILTFTDENKLKQEWTHFEAGKVKGTSIFLLKKKG